MIIILIERYMHEEERKKNLKVTITCHAVMKKRRRREQDVYGDRLRLLINTKSDLEKRRESEREIVYGSMKI